VGSWAGRRSIVRAALAVAGAVLVSLALFAGAGAAGRGAGSATGTLELCKAADGGAAGSAFSFTLTSGTTSLSEAVTGGTCTDVSVAAGNWTITEDLQSGTFTMTGATVLPDSAWLSENDRTGKVRVAVSSGGDTQVTISNQQAAATIKVCKWSSSQQLQQKQFSFTVGQQAVTAVAGGSPDTAGCSATVATQPGSRLRIAEAVPASETVASVTTSANASLTNLGGGVVRVTAGAGATVVTFENEPLGPPQTGYLELCKDAGDNYISTTTPFGFTLTDSAGLTVTENVYAGQCTGAIKVAAGNVTVSETPTDGTFVSSVSAVPSSALGLTNLANGTATVVVPVAQDRAGEVQVDFTNSTRTGKLKICKVLTPTSGDLAGQTFQFDILSRSVTDVDSLPIVASANGGACKIFATPLPVGSTATVTEEPTPDVSANGQPAGTGASVQVTIGSTTTTATFTNQAFGQLEICKKMQTYPTNDRAFDGTVFHFSVDGSPTETDVAAGVCSLPQLVPAGTHTVKEVDLPYGFQFVSSTATGPLGDNRATSGGNPITVSVPYLDSGGETQVTVVDKVIRASLKICKLVDPHSQAALGSSTFSFFYTVVNDVGGFSEGVDVPAGTCTGLINGDATHPNPYGFPIVNSDGSPTFILVTEGLTGGFHITSITVTGGVLDPLFNPNPDPVCTGTVVVDPTGGPVVATFTNASGDADQTQCL